MPEGKSLFPADSAPVAGAHRLAVRIPVAGAGLRALPACAEGMDGIAHAR
jgi:hypothetical protein